MGDLFHVFPKKQLLEWSGYFPKHQVDHIQHQRAAEQRSCNQVYMFMYYPQLPCADALEKIMLVGGVTSCHMRLSAQLLQTTWNQMELQFQSDLIKMREWGKKFDLFSHQQVCACVLTWWIWVFSWWVEDWKQR